MTSATAVAACSVADAPFVFLNAMYIKRSAECGAKNASDGIKTLVLISFATSAALLGFVLTPAQRGRILPEFFFVACRYKATQLTKLRGLIAHGNALKARREELVAILPAAHTVGEWSVQDVCDWVGRTSGLEGIQAALAANGVDGTALLCMNANDASIASSLGLSSPFLFRHLCLRRDELLASLVESAPTTSAVDAMMLEALLSQPSQPRGFREMLYACFRPRRQLPAPRRPRQRSTDGDFELADAMDGTAVLASRDRPTVLTGVC